MSPQTGKSDLEYADDVVPLSANSKLQFYHDRLSHSVGVWDILHLGGVKCCCTTELTQSRTNRVRWKHLVTRVVVSHMVLVYRMKRPQTYRGLDLYLPI